MKTNNNNTNATTNQQF